MFTIIKNFPTEAEKEILKDALVWLYENSFFNALKEDKEGDWIDNNRDRCRSEDIWFENGCTKYIIGVHSVDWVLKVSIPSVARDRHCDYANYEADIYEAAVKAGLQNYFASTYHFGTIAGLNVIIQECAHCDEDYYFDRLFEYCEGGFDRDEFEDEDDYISAIDEEVNCIDIESSLYAIFEDVPQELIDFMTAHNLGDLHARNYGEINEMPVLIDFCGY